MTEEFKPRYERHPELPSYTEVGPAEYTKAYNKLMRKQRRCRQCGDSIVGQNRKYTRCLECREYNEKKNRIKREQLKSAGLCTRCGKEPIGKKSRVFCDPCRTLANQKALEYYHRKGYKKRKDIRG